MKKNCVSWGIAQLACFPLLAAAQTAPSEVSKSAPQLAYRSAFADYKPYKDEPPGDWRKVNDAVVPAKGGASAHAGHDTDGMKAIAPRAPAVAASSAAMKPQTDMPMRGGQRHHGSKP